MRDPRCNLFLGRVARDHREAGVTGDLGRAVVDRQDQRTPPPLQRPNAAMQPVADIVEPLPAFEKCIISLERGRENFGAALRELRDIVEIVDPLRPDMNLAIAAREQIEDTGISR
ncbi:hypothetical protein TP2_07355 [Thioclava pacifica DSM 10166]|uniref:Uncharacterized protein n=1 Tax=Thioclava pacifica DSM 10166 TaxID=1353537 RepID=A0A074J5K3_9RHOB|nr:hypothetical protein TP2_07355 [Thioclava pacifica DSM 10166]